MRSPLYTTALAIPLLVATTSPIAFSAGPTADARTSAAKSTAKKPSRASRQTPTSPAVAQHGTASYYAKHFDGRKTASGERYDPGALTAAHRTLPLGTQVKVVNPKNDKSVVVTVNDRGPVSKNRMIDVSSAAADELGMKKSGVTKVEAQVLPKPGGDGPAR